MRTQLIAIAALVGASAFSVNAQTPQTRPPSQPQEQRPATPRTGDTTQRADATGAQTVTVTGCLKAEKDVPGRRPNAAERAGVTEDYILTGVKMAQSSATSGIGLAPMYEIEGISEAELQKHLNHQVEITGTLNRSAASGTGTGATGTTGTGTTGSRPTGTGATGTGATGSTAAGNTQGTNADLPELRGTSLKMVSATCPAQ
jgi:hypothetical protein